MVGVIFFLQSPSHKILMSGVPNFDQQQSERFHERESWLDQLQQTFGRKELSKFPNDQLLQWLQR